MLRLEREDFLKLVSQCQVLSSEITKTMAARVGRLTSSRSSPAAVVTVIGDAHDPACYDLREFLSRNGVPFVWREDRPRQLAGVAPRPSCSPTDAAGGALVPPRWRRRWTSRPSPGTTATTSSIVGGGPAGLAAAVYGASEGLRTLLVERNAPGRPGGHLLADRELPRLPRRARAATS